MSGRIRQRNSAGFTLIELVISGALMTLILVGAYMCLSASVASQKLVEPRVELLQNARVAMALLTADLRSACPLSTNYQFLGMQRTVGEMEADNLDFATHNYTPRRPREGDFCEVSYFVDQDAQTGQFSLFRRRNPVIALDPLSGGSREEIARGLKGLKFEYYDGFDWYDTWGDAEKPDKTQYSAKDYPNLYGMPEAVRVTMWFDQHPRSASSKAPAATAADEHATNEPPLVFQTVARLNLAASSQKTRPGAPTDSGTNDPASSGPAGTGNGGGY